MTICEEYQAVMAPSPGPTIETLPCGSTLATVSSAEVNLVQRVTSRSAPSLKVARTVSFMDSPTLAWFSLGEMVSLASLASVDLGAGAPWAIQLARIR